MSDRRESWQHEQDADMILPLYRKKSTTAKTTKNHRRNHLVKHRTAKSATHFLLTFQGPFDAPFANYVPEFLRRRCPSCEPLIRRAVIDPVPCGTNTATIRGAPGPRGRELSWRSVRPTPMARPIPLPTALGLAEADAFAVARLDGGGTEGGRESPIPSCCSELLVSLHEPFCNRSRHGDLTW